MLIRQFATFIAALTTSALLAGCTSPAVLGMVYDRSAKKASREIQQIASFNDSQRLYINDRLMRFHRWHRETQLPRYARLIREIASTLQQHQVSKPTVKSWMSEIEALSSEMTRCNPLNDSLEFLSQLTDRQVTEISVMMEEDHIEDTERYQEETVDERKKRQEQHVLKWARRSGLVFNPAQKQLLANTLLQQKSLGRQRLDLHHNWSLKFGALLADRQQQSFVAETGAHIQRLWSLTKTAYPQKWDGNTRLWEFFIHRFLELQTPDARRVMVRKASNIANTIDTIATKSVEGPAAKCFAGKNS